MEILRRLESGLAFQQFKKRNDFRDAYRAKFSWPKLNEERLIACGLKNEYSREGDPSLRRKYIARRANASHKQKVLTVLADLRCPPNWPEKLATQPPLIFFYELGIGPGLTKDHVATGQNGVPWSY